ncbi:MAG: methyltransferase MtaB domain-containing protein [Nitrososphaeria archaeon]
MKFGSVALDPERLIFGFALHPLRYGNELEIGNGYVVPEIKYFPRVGKNLKEEYETITEQVLRRAVSLGIERLQLETELTYIEMETSTLAGEIVRLQKDLIEKYAAEYGLNLGLRVTVADIRDFGKPKHDEQAFSKMIKTFEDVASNGADVLSIESEGGKELFNHAIIRQDILGVVSSLGYLAMLDMKKLWKEIVRIAENKHVIAGGDSACAFGNTSMRLAGGLRDNVIAHSLAAIVRGMSASRSLIAYEEGAVGPGKDCAYENVIIKAITGYPMSMEGKTSACAHSSLVGNVIASACDLWSNEQVENIRLFGGYGPEVFLEILHYDTKMMNEAIKSGRSRLLKEVLVNSDKYSDPQAYVLSPDVAYVVANAIVDEKDTLSRTISAGLKVASLLANEKGWTLGKSEQRFLGIAKSRLEDVYSDPYRKVEQALTTYEQKVEKLKIRDYLQV